jgi:HEAT repeat protein
MRTLIVMLTVAGVIFIGTTEADVPKKIDVAKQISLLKNAKTARERAAAADELGRHGAIRARDVKDAVEPLLGALKDDKDADVRRASAKALGNIAPDSKLVVPALTEALKDKSMAVKLAAVTALGQYGGDARSALPPLRELAGMKNDKKLSQAARVALKSIAGKKK